MPRYTVVWQGDGDATAEASALEIAEQLGVGSVPWSRVEEAYARRDDLAGRGFGYDDEGRMSEHKELIEEDAWRPALD